MRKLNGVSRSRQRGWVGLIVLVVALVIVAMLVKTVLNEYGLTGTTGTASKATAIDPVSQDVNTVDSSPRNAMERARGLESSVQQQAAEQAKRIDDALKR